MFKTVWRDDTGRQRSRTFSLKRDAESYEAKIKLAKRQGELATLDAGRQKLRDFDAEYWRLYAEPTLAPKTLEVYSSLRNRYILPRLGETELRALTTERVQAFQVALASEGIGRETIRKTLALLQGMLERAVEWGRLTRNPVRYVKKPSQRRLRTVRPLSPAQIEQLRVEMLGRGWLRDATLISVLAYAGLRPGEALALRWKDVGSRTLVVDKAISLGKEKTTKTGQARTVPLIAALVEDLKVWRAASAGVSDDSLVFPRHDGQEWSDHDFRNWRRRRFVTAASAESVGLSDARPYDLRHSYASLLIAEQNNPAEIARRLGHTLQTLFSTYAHVIEEVGVTERVDASNSIREARAVASSG